VHQRSKTQHACTRSRCGHASVETGHGPRCRLCKKKKPFLRYFVSWGALTPARSASNLLATALVGGAACSCARVPQAPRRPTGAPRRRLFPHSLVKRRDALAATRERAAQQPRWHRRLPPSPLAVSFLGHLHLLPRRRLQRRVPNSPSPVHGGTYKSSPTPAYGDSPLTRRHRDLVADAVRPHGPHSFGTYDCE
jgi:hypothetical protein